MSTANSPIFIVGAPRSGTTLIAQILSNHQNIFIFNESLIYDFIIAQNLASADFKIAAGQLPAFIASRVKSRIGDSSINPDNFGCRFTPDEALEISAKLYHYVDDMEFSHRSYSSLFAGCMKIIASCKGRGRWGDKTPNHVFYLDRIAKDFPDSKIIHIVRDPRSFLRSYKFAWRQFGANKSTKKLYHPIVTSLLWCRSVRAFLKFVDQGNTSRQCVNIRYEDLTECPDKTVRKVLEFLGEPFSSQILDVKGTNTSFRKRKETLDPWELELCEAICNELMQKYDYEPSFSSPSFGTWAKSISSLVPFLLDAGKVLKSHYRGSLVQYLRSRKLLP
jgi:hypothetical protein